MCIRDRFEPPVKMNTALTQTVRVSIILLMLFMQSAMIDHGIEHAELEHVEDCVECISVDNQTAFVAKIVSFDAGGFIYSWVQLASQLFIQTKPTYHLSRAPPYLFAV